MDPDALARDYSAFLGQQCFAFSAVFLSLIPGKEHVRIEVRLATRRPVMKAERPTVHRYLFSAGRWEEEYTRYLLGGILRMILARSSPAALLVPKRVTLTHHTHLDPEQRPCGAHRARVCFVAP